MRQVPECAAVIRVPGQDQHDGGFPGRDLRAAVLVDRRLALPIGVCIFFCVSGYVIILSVGDLRQKHGVRSAPHFVVCRAFRLIPVYCILAAVLWVLAPPDLRAQITANFQAKAGGYWLRFFTLTSYYGLDRTVYRGLEWTLAFEVTFYVVCTMCILLGRWLARPRFLYLPLFVLCATALMPPHLTDNKAQYFSLICLFFMCGAIAYAWQSKILSDAEFGVMITACIGAICLRVLLWAIQYHDLNSMTIASPIALAVFFLVLCSKAQMPRCLAWIGLISYSLYLLHDTLPLIVPLAGEPVWIRLPVWTGLSIIAAAVSYRLIERPAVSVGRTVLRW